MTPVVHRLSIGGGPHTKHKQKDKKKVNKPYYNPSDRSALKMKLVW